MLVGAAPWGMFSDAYGRRTGWLVTTALTAGAGVVSAALPNGSVGAFTATRFLVGFGLAGTNLGFALAAEFLPQRSRGRLLVLFELCFSAGSVLMVPARARTTHVLTTPSAQHMLSTG